ncbi:hypothetical protein [Burkholderia ubonensis]|uniref:hypothetical protein n=1 Tax=Burkholderia ubonensis TaxID=101571 RepID=UPI0011607071|nr:hypothetical protein [Burkholderia ubonensis]
MPSIQFHATSPSHHANPIESKQFNKSSQLHHPTPHIIDTNRIKAIPADNSPLSNALRNAMSAMRSAQQNPEFIQYARASNLSAYSMRATPEDGIQLERMDRPGTWVTVPAGPWSDAAADAITFSKRLGGQIEYGKLAMPVTHILRFYGFGNTNIYDVNDANDTITLLDSLISDNEDITRQTVRIYGHDTHHSPIEYKAMTNELRHIKNLLEKSTGNISPRSSAAENNGTSETHSPPPINLHRDYPINFSSGNSNGGEEAPTLNWSRYVAESLTIGGATVAFVGTSAGALNALTATQSSAITTLGNAAVVAGGALAAVIAPGALTGLGTLGAGAVLYRNIMSLADQLGFSESLDESAVYVEMGGYIILFSVGTYQTAESLDGFIKNPTIKNALATAGSALATTGVGLASAPGAKVALQHAKYGRLSDLKKYLDPTKEFEVLGSGFTAAGTTAVTAADLLPDNRQRTLTDIVLESYSGGRAGISRPHGQ